VDFQQEIILFQSDNQHLLQHPMRLLLFW